MHISNCKIWIFKRTIQLLQSTLQSQCCFIWNFIRPVYLAKTCGFYLLYSWFLTVWNVDLNLTGQRWCTNLILISYFTLKWCSYLGKISRIRSRVMTDFYYLVHFSLLHWSSFVAIFLSFTCIINMKKDSVSCII